MDYYIIEELEAASVRRFDAAKLGVSFGALLSWLTEKSVQKISQVQQSITLKHEFHCFSKSISSISINISVSKIPMILILIHFVNCLSTYE